MTYHSQLGQDERLNRELFHDRRGLVFVDVGAYDGVTFSNTLFFEKELGWKGICVEPHPQVYAKLRANRTCACVNAAAWHESAKLIFRVANDHGCKGAIDNQLEMLSGCLESMDPRHKARLDRCSKTHGGEWQDIEVPAVTVLDLFVEHLLRQTMSRAIDYLTVDVENAELQVLKGVGLDKLHVNVIDFEVEHAETGDDLRRTAAIYDLLVAHGFRHHCDIGWDRVFINNNLKWSHG